MKQKEWLAQKLFDKGLISEHQFISIKAYRSLGIFSLRDELLFLMYLSVLLFTTGVGIVIYQNIDSIGHLAILAIILALAAGCFVFSYKKAPQFSTQETAFENPVYDNVVLTGTLLTCIFFGYLQTRYNALGNGYSIAAFASAVISLGAAYYFDNRSALAIGITALAAFVGITATPEAVIKNEMYAHPAQSYFGLLLGLMLIGWAEYSRRAHIKEHFILIITNFALHLIGICCLKGLFENLWPFFVAVMAAACFYFYRKSYELAASSIFVFTMIYAYFTVNIVIAKLLEALESFALLEFIAFVSPVYLVLSILLFIRLTKKFNRATNDGEE